MNLSEPQDNSESEFIFEKEIGFDSSMKEYAKIVILQAIKEYPFDEHGKCIFVSEKFEESYGGNWSCSFIKSGDSSVIYYDFYGKIKYGDYSIKIAKTSE